MNKFECDIAILQENLSELRKIAGWTAETLAEKIGVTKQTISNIETAKVPMSRVQYITLRSVIECEIYLNQENPALKKVFNLLFSIGQKKIYQEKKTDIRAAIISIGSTAMAGIDKMQLFSIATTLLAPFTKFVDSNISCGVPTLEWLIESLNEIEEN